MVCGMVSPCWMPSTCTSGLRTIVLKYPMPDTAKPCCGAITCLMHPISSPAPGLRPIQCVSIKHGHAIKEVATFCDSTGKKLRDWEFEVSCILFLWGWGAWVRCPDQLPIGESSLSPLSSVELTVLPRHFPPVHVDTWQLLLWIYPPPRKHKCCHVRECLYHFQG